jgi:hypothetical protein
MLYCELDDAFNNKTYKFRESFSNGATDDFNISKIDMNKFNVSNNKIMYDSDKKGQESDWAAVDSDTELLPKKKSWNKDDTISVDSESENSKEENKSSRSNDLVGTTLTKLIKNRKPTHRECIKLYYNPTLKSDFCFDVALKHITKCELCKKEISKKKSVKFSTEKINNKTNNKLSGSEDKVSCSSSLNSFINNLREIRKTKNIKEDFQTDNETLLELVKSTKKPTLNKNKSEIDEEKIASIKSQIELQSPPAKPMTQVVTQNQQNQQNQQIDNNIQFQNVMIQNTIQKYFEDMEEKKELNNKLNKIYEILNSEIKKNEIIDKERALFQLKNNTGSNFEINYVLVGISIVIILLIVDIVIRIKF